MPQKQSYQHASFFRGASLIVGVFTMSAIISFAVLAWTGPTANPPANNTPTPLNESNTSQTKEGGLTLNTGGATNGLIVQSGNVGIGTTSPGAKLEVNGGVKIG